MKKITMIGTRILLIFSLMLVLSAFLVAPAFAALEENITVTYEQAFIGISGTTPATWAMNGITGDGKVRPNTIYYTNPLGDETVPSATVVDGECRFSTTNDSNVAIDVFLNMTDTTGGTDPMLNSDDGSNGEGTFGAYGWYSGMTYASKVPIKTSGSVALIESLAASTPFKWGIELENQSDAWAGTTQGSGTLTVSIMED